MVGGSRGDGEMGVIGAMGEMWGIGAMGRLGWGDRAMGGVGWGIWEGGRS